MSRVGMIPDSSDFTGKSGSGATDQLPTRGALVIANCRVWHLALVLRNGLSHICRSAPTADIDILRHLQEERSAFDLRKLRTKPPNDLICRDIALVARLQGDEEVAVVLRLCTVGAEAIIADLPARKSPAIMTVDSP